MLLLLRYVVVVVALASVTAAPNATILTQDVHHHITEFLTIQNITLLARTSTDWLTISRESVIQRHAESRQVTMYAHITSHGLWYKLLGSTITTLHPIPLLNSFFYQSNFAPHTTIENNEYPHTLIAFFPEAFKEIRLNVLTESIDDESNLPAVPNVMEFPASHFATGSFPNWSSPGQSFACAIKESGDFEFTSPRPPFRTDYVPVRKLLTATQITASNNLFAVANADTEQVAVLSLNDKTWRLLPDLLCSKVFRSLYFDETQNLCTSVENVNSRNIEVYCISLNSKEPKSWILQKELKLEPGYFPIGVLPEAFVSSEVAKSANSKFVKPEASRKRKRGSIF